MREKLFKIVVIFLIPKSSSRIRGKTGGLVRLAEILKRFSIFRNIEINLISSDENYAEYFGNYSIKFKFRYVKTKLKIKNPVDLCLKSLIIIAKYLFAVKMDFPKKEDEKLILYSSSDLFWEVIPAFIYKVKNKEIEWVQIIHHIYPDWKKRPGSRIASFCGYYLQKFSLALIKKKADKIILMNNLVCGELLKRGFPAEKMHVSANGLDLNYLNSVSPSALSYDGVFLGRMNASKGVDDLLPIWKKVCEKMPAAKLAIIGGAEKTAKAELIQKIKATGLEKNIEVLGFLEDQQALGLLKSGKVFVFPSHEEGWGIAVAEAMACGLPVVSWNLPVYREVFESYTAQIKENNLELFSAKVMEFMEDDQLRERIGVGGKEFVKKYSWDAVAKRELEIICS